MHLDKRDWRTRLFFWALGICDEFRGYDTAYRYEAHTNLCHFMRVIVVWMPFVLFLHVLLVAAAVGAVTVWPIRLFGWTTWLGILAGIAFVVGVVIAVKKASEYQRHRRWERPAVPRTVPAPAPAAAIQEEAEPESPSTWELIWAWIVAQKQKVCPIISFTETKEANRA